MRPRILLALFCFCCLSASPGYSQVFESRAPTLLMEEGAGEGPAWHPDRGLFTSGHGGIHLRNLDGKSQMFMSDAGTNGLSFDRKGRLLLCQQRFRKVSRFDFETQQIELLTDRFSGERYNKPNDLALDSQGRIYFSDPCYGDRSEMEMKDSAGTEIEGVYRIDRGGRVVRIITHEVDRPNGLLVSLQDRFLYVADNNNNHLGGARKLWRFKLKIDGNINSESKKLIYDWKTGRGPDGMAQDVDGRIYVAGGLNKAHPPFETAKNFKGGIYVLSSEGELLDFVAIPRDEVTNCAFGGPDLKTLYITAGGSLWSIRTTALGCPVWPQL